MIYLTLLDEDICNTRSDFKLEKTSELSRNPQDKYNGDNNQITSTVLEHLTKNKLWNLKRWISITSTSTEDTRNRTNL